MYVKIIMPWLFHEWYNMGFSYNVYIVHIKENSMYYIIQEMDVTYPIYIGSNRMLITNINTTTNQ